MVKKKTNNNSKQRKLSPSVLLGSFVKHIKSIITEEPLFAIMLTTCGIEYLGKCINNFQDWEKDGQSRCDFELAINKYDSFKEYRQWLKDFDLYKELRCGLIHSLAPSSRIIVKDKGENEVNGDKLTLSAEQLLNDFNKAVQSFRNDKQKGKKAVGTPYITVTNTPAGESLTAKTVD